MREKKIALINRSGKPVKLFENKAKAQRFCVENKICNAGWVSRSLETGEKFYYTPTGVSISHNGYQGAGMCVKWVWKKTGSEK
jgi:hypothetical protein